MAEVSATGSSCWGLGSPWLPLFADCLIVDSVVDAGAGVGVGEGDGEGKAPEWTLLAVVGSCAVSGDGVGAAFESVLVSVSVCVSVLVSVSVSVCVSLGGST